MEDCTSPITIDQVSMSETSTKDTKKDKKKDKNKEKEELSTLKKKFKVLK